METFFCSPAHLFIKLDRLEGVFRLGWRRGHQVTTG